MTISGKISSSISLEISGNIAGGENLYPSNIPNLQAWYDTSSDDYLTLDGTAITQFLDRSGNGNHTSVQATSTKRPTRTLDELNGLQAATFDGGDTLELPSALHSLINGNNTIILIASQTQASASDYIIGFTESGGGRAYIKSESTTGQFIGLNRTSDANATRITGVTNADYNIFTKIYQNNMQSLRSNFNEPVVNLFGIAESGIDAAHLGSKNNTQEFLTGGIAEVLIYDRGLTATEVAILNTYLAKKYGITLATENVISPQSLSLNAGLTSDNVLGQQGVAYDGTHYYVSGTNALYKYDSDWSLVTSTTDVIGDAGLAAPIDHCGDIAINDGKIYVPIEEFPNSPYNTQYIGVFNTSDLSFDTVYDISAQAQEASSIAYNSTDGYLWVGSFVTLDNFLRYTTAGVYVDTVTSNASITQRQGCCFFGGYLWVTESVYQSVHQFTLDGKYIGEAYRFSGISEIEGICAAGDYLAVLAIDGSSNKNIYFLS